VDVWGRTKRIDPPTGPYVTYVYDKLDRLTHTTRAGNTTEIEYDELGRKKNMSDPDMGYWEYQYDALGNLTFQTDARGCVLALSYDKLNRLQTKNSSGNCNQQVNITYFYDSDDPDTLEVYDPTQINQKGYRTYMTDSSSETGWVYDIRGRLFAESRIIDEEVYNTGWSYNSADLLETMTYPGEDPDREILTYAYNSDGTMQTVTSNQGGVYLNDMQYDAAGRLSLIQYGTGVISKTFTYYPWNTEVNGGLLQTASATSLQNLSYTYDKNGNVETITDSLAGPQTQTFTYDALNRLTSAAVTGGANGLYSESYEYDPTSGNLTNKGDLTLTYQAASESACQNAPDGHAIPHDRQQFL